MRKLVTVRQVDSIHSIKDADAIECAVVEGWEVVIKKDEFKVGDVCVFFEIDSFLPLTDQRYQFLEKSKITWHNQEGVRLRTLKLRGQISQGLILPIALFPEIQEKITNLSFPEIRQLDFTEELNIQKWEPIIPQGLSGEVVGSFPSFIAKTDQERIQNLAHLLTEEKSSTFEVTIKLDGSSMTVFFNNGETGICSRNWQLKDTTGNALWTVAHKNKLLEALTTYQYNIALQGEIMGEGIQGNHEKIQGYQFYLYDIYDINKSRYLSYQERQQVIQELKELGAELLEVPLLETTTLEKFENDLGNILAYAEGPSLNPKVEREGLVFKREDGQLSFKVISNKYLLKHSDR